MEFGVGVCPLIQTFPLVSPSLLAFFCPRYWLPFGEVFYFLLSPGQGITHPLAFCNSCCGALAHPSPDKMQNAKNEETQEKQNETEKEGEAWPQPGLMAPWGPLP